MNEVVFLISLAFVWIVFASIQDLRSREVSNWVSFSLIIFAMGFRVFYSLFSPESGWDFSLFYQGLIGLAIFFALGNLFYHGRIFAGGDAKLMIALGAVLPLSESLLSNLWLFTLFFIIFLFAGAAYGFLWSFVLAFKNLHGFKKEFSFLLNQNKKYAYASLFSGLIFASLGFFASESLFFSLGILVFAMPYLYFYARAVDETCMIKEVRSSQLTEGDWLYKDLKLGKGKNKTIKASWEGLSKEDIDEIRKKYKKRVKIRQGIPFVPVFLIALIIFIWSLKNFGISL